MKSPWNAYKIVIQKRTFDGIICKVRLMVEGEAQHGPDFDTEEEALKYLEDNPISNSPLYKYYDN